MVDSLNSIPNISWVAKDYGEERTYGHIEDESIKFISSFDE
jgi:hypothetical protein